MSAYFVGTKLPSGYAAVENGRREVLTVNQGSEFTVRLPLSPVQSAAPIRKPRATTVQHGKRHILIVDDDEDTAVSLSVLLEGDGYETRTAASGSAALLHASEFQADVVLLDISLPDMSGHEVARQMRANPPRSDLLLIALTGWSQEQDRQTALDAGFDHYLLKPVHYDRLLALLNQDA